ncbi:39K protein [Agrotis ipsilon multiple nucleopolyhedrovirus]|uniref:PP31 n=1 Tax=Agrotis ipsilon multiple nucleopolyhedrovirus TaxID=208013 RepID=B6D653_9ABAC|nr:39K protein [Agrotis ipsilon multiple nucleopolyhedrovirus]ACI28840.1 PP31 [Agrotis ipsilon multiple nucleopolyhedrovirus]
MTTTNALTEMYSKFEGSVIYDKAHMEQVTTAINILEKKKIKYKIIPMPVYGDEGLEVTFAIIIVIDKKNAKRNKKVISNNKYILFNSWYTKNRSESWPNSHTMWNLMKQQPAAKPFIDIFDFMEKVGKSIEVKKQPSSDESNGAAAADNNCEIKESNERRVKLYTEFYRIATATFASGNAPSSSFIYDIKLGKNAGGGGGGSLERMNRQILENGIEAFKTVLFKQNQPSSSKQQQNKIKELPSTSSPYEEKSVSRKRKQSTPAAAVVNNNTIVAPAAKQAKKGKASREPVVPVLTMEDDHTDDTQMSFT